MDDRGDVVASLMTPLTVDGIIASRNEGKIGSAEMMRLLGRFKYSQELENAFIDDLITVSEYMSLVHAAKALISAE